MPDEPDISNIPFGTADAPLVIPADTPGLVNIHPNTPPVRGYRDLTQAEVDTINSIKAAEIDLGELWRQIGTREDIDKRWMAIAKTHFEEGFSAFVRAVAQPEPRF